MWDEKGQSGWQASLGWGGVGVVLCCGWSLDVVGGLVAQGLVFDEKRIQWKTNLWSLDPDGEAYSVSSKHWKISVDAESHP